MFGKVSMQGRIFIMQFVFVGTSTSEATHAQGEESVEDADNTDHDVSGTAEIASEAINQQEDVMDADEISDGFSLIR